MQQRQCKERNSFSCCGGRNGDRQSEINVGDEVRKRIDIYSNDWILGQYGGVGRGGYGGINANVGRKTEPALADN